MAAEKRENVEIDERLELGSKNSKMGSLDSVLRLTESIREEAVEPVVDVVPIGLDLNACVKETNKSKVFGLDLNAEDVSSSINNDHHLHPRKNLDFLKSKDDSECASSVGPLEERDPLQVWKEMKKNGFISSSHACVTIPKKRGRKVKTDGVKKKVKIAKKENLDKFPRKDPVDRFSKIAAPSGLLNGLNLGIMNHVRNSKQVHSIIDALVKSEQNEKSQALSKPESRTKFITKGFSEQKYESHPVTQLLDPHPSFQIKGYPDSTCMIEPQIVGVQSENINYLSNENSGNVNSLSVKAASVASQWLGLLHQDVKGRLAALRRSKKRVCEVIQTELPCLLSREFPSNLENATGEMHRTRWGSLFHQMDRSLSEEEKQLENWLSQVKQMQLHCDMGLFNHNTTNGLKQIDMDFRLKKVDKLEGDLSVRAAAASIYSTCNFLSSVENQPCC